MNIKSQNHKKEEITLFSNWIPILGKQIHRNENTKVIYFVSIPVL